MLHALANLLPPPAVCVWCCLGEISTLSQTEKSRASFLFSAGRCFKAQRASINKTQSTLPGAHPQMFSWPLCSVLHPYITCHLGFSRKPGTASPISIFYEHLLLGCPWLQPKGKTPFFLPFFLTNSCTILKIMPDMRKYDFPFVNLFSVNH